MERIFWLALFGPILVPIAVGTVLVLKLKVRLKVRANVITPKFSGYFFAWAALFSLAWVVIVFVVTAITNSNLGPLALIAVPWAFALGAAFGVLRWYLRHYAT
jgi:hypothetical protein